MHGVGELPPPGTKCVNCGCCPAAIYAGKDPVCWECDENIPCKGRQRALTTTQMTKVEQIADSADSKTEKASLKVARLLRPRNYLSNRRKATTPMSPAQSPVSTQPAASAAAAAVSEDHQVEVIDDRAKGLAGGAAAAAYSPLYLQYTGVIADLEAKRIDLDRMINTLRALQHAAR